MKVLTDKEQEVLEHLDYAGHCFVNLSVSTSTLQINEFISLINHCKNMVLARPTIRAIEKEEAK
jgi:hypothetical protein